MQPVRQEDIDEAVAMLGPEAEDWLREFHGLVMAKLADAPYDKARFVELKALLGPFMQARFDRAMKQAQKL